MALYLRNGIYWCGFRYKGERVQESTGEHAPRKAAQYQEDRRSEIRKAFEARAAKAAELGCASEMIRKCGECERLFNFGSPVSEEEFVFCGEDCQERWRKRQCPVPTLRTFLEKQFLPSAETEHAAKPATLRYYKQGVTSLLASSLAEHRLDKIKNENAVQYAAKHKKLSASTINQGLRTLRRALNLAADWGVLDSRTRITLAKGEKQRDRVLSDSEVKAYLDACEQPWRDCATIMLGTGMRPSEVFRLRWERVQLNGHGGLLQIAEGKSKAARRMLPLVRAVYEVLKARFEKAGKPEKGWVFLAEKRDGPLQGGSAKNYHARALAAIAKAAAERDEDNPVKPFPPYTFRHTALTRLGEAGCDAFTLMKIAGHSSISITQRYIHPQAEAIERAFSKFDGNSLHSSLLSENGSATPQLAASR